MLGVGVLFGLGLWLLLTYFVARLGGKLTANLGWGKWPGIFLGFMLIMGGFIVYWIWEYIAVQNYVAKLCKEEAGVIVYVPPEEWRKQLGEKEWEKNVKLDYFERQNHPRDEVLWDGKMFRQVAKENSRLGIYSYTGEKKMFTVKFINLVLDTTNGQKILSVTWFSTGVGAWLAGGSFKLWLNTIHTCSDKETAYFNALLRLYSTNSSMDK
ncbi:MAG: hypothetical protein Q4G28_06485 [Neisseria sp.]|nr:hypothetical protein [Neisseria sp.]